MKALNFSLFAVAAVALVAAAASSSALAASPDNAWSPAALNHATGVDPRHIATASVTASANNNTSAANAWSPDRLHPVAQDPLQSYESYIAMSRATINPWLPSELARASQHGLH